MNALLRTLLCCSVLLLGACSLDSDDESEEPDDHAWKAQTDALDKARNVEQRLQDAAKEKRRALERQTQ